ncbi:MAG: phosphodiester glycosidase family protein [Clostridia bacterium]|nr:phosphodiester glycosidase family protein [Clostridia bacterium]
MNSTNELNTVENNNDNFNENSSMRRRQINKINKRSKMKKILIILLTPVVILILSVLTLLYGPWNGFRDWVITSAMTTMNHQYFATWFYDEKTIQDALDRNKVIETSANTDSSLIALQNTDTGKNSSNIKQEVVYKNKYEREILEKDNENDSYKMINIEGKGYKGYLVAIYDPSKLQTVVTKKLDRYGQYLVDMAKEHDAVLAINGGGFYDPDFSSTGGSPLGITFSNGKVITQNAYSGPGGLIGFDTDNKLILGKYTINEAKKANIRDAVTFGPFLIVNGVPSKVLGNGGWGTAPRSAIGQRQDGIVLLLVVDGRSVKYPGADMDDLIEVMQRYGAYNAANLDGGTSSVLVVNNKIVNDPIDSTGAHQTRPIATGFILTK